ncbi:MAG: toprim domain-containing protein, partial [Synergistaceae bacterium]|nr:toprim domain-containing protein [Synergistaceae bacterium]
LSYDTLRKLGHIEPQDGWRLSLGGTAMLALTHLIERQKFKQPIAHCVVCTDRDTAGDLVFSEISEKLTIRVSRSIPVGKDWNETLQQIRNEVKLLEYAGNYIHKKADFMGKIDKLKSKAAAQEPVAPNPYKSRDGLE